LTGRTHQIRIHLHHTGYPIVQDPLYNNGNDDKLQTYFDEINEMRRSTVPNNTNESISNTSNYSNIVDTIVDRLHNNDFGKVELVSHEPLVENKRKADSELDLLVSPKKQKNIDDAIDESRNKDCSSNNIGTVDNIASSDLHLDIEELNGSDSMNSLERSVLSECPDCKIKDPALYDPKTDELYIYLHAYCYFSKDFSYKTKIPPWASSAELSTADVDINNIDNFDSLFTMQRDAKQEKNG
jgi:hypothetical protein